jgi:hypothetical protein
MNTTNYGTEIVNNFEKQGESKDFIIGFLQATLNGLRHLENDKVLEYMKRSVEQSKKA